MTKQEAKELLRKLYGIIEDRVDGKKAEHINFAQAANRLGEYLDNTIPETKPKKGEKDTKSKKENRK